MDNRSQEKSLSFPDLGDRVCCHMKYLVLIFSVFLVGCNKPYSNMNYSELKDYGAIMKIESYHLVITLKNPPGVMVHKIGSVEHEGKVIIYAHRISSGGGEKTYRVDLSFHTLPHDIYERVYWLNPDGSLTKLHPAYL